MLPFMKYPLAPLFSKFATLIAAATLCASGSSFAQSPSASPSASINDRAVVLGILAAEFSLQSGDVAAAANTYYEIAKRSRDAKVAERAVDLLLRARRIDEAKEIAALWQETDGGSVRPHQIALALALTSADEFRAMGQRSRRFRTTTSPIFAPKRMDSSPRRTVSTSGNSGIRLV